MKIYIAGFYDTKSRLLPMARLLEAMGHEITAEWLKEGAESYSSVTDCYRLACAIGDTGDVKRSDLFIVDTIDESNRGGREFEFGVAFTSGIPVFMVGPYRNVFHQLARLRFESWDSLLRYMTHISRGELK